MGNKMILVRPEESEDQAEIRKVRDAAVATLRQTYRPGRKAIENKARLSPDLKRLVAVCGGRIVGTVQYYSRNRCLHITGLGVLEDYRQKGVARSLVYRLEKICPEQKATRLKLHTIKETGNVEVFKRLGFTVIAEREDDFFESDRFERLTNVEMFRQCRSVHLLPGQLYGTD